jgi:hypothetical protein
MVTVGKARYWIYVSLMAKPRRVYLVAMWIVCGELRELYAPWIVADGEALMSSTMDLVRDVVIDGETGQTARRGVDLAEAWEAFTAAHEDEAPCGGLLNAWGTFAGLAEEIGGLAGAGAGAQWFLSAAEERWRDWNRPGPILVSREHAEELTESSPMGQTFDVLYRVVARVSGLAGPEWDPVRIRAGIFPGRLRLRIETRRRARRGRRLDHSGRTRAGNLYGLSFLECD